MKNVTPPKYNEFCCDIQLQDSRLYCGFGFKQHYHAISETGILFSLIVFLFTYLFSINLLTHLSIK